MSKFKMDQRETCPACHKESMPKWSTAPDSVENARACQDQACGHVETKIWSNVALRDKAQIEGAKLEREEKGNEGNNPNT